jgi:hypothetical protein
MALNTAPKYNIISPCWFELKPEELNGKFQIKVYIYILQYII